MSALPTLLAGGDSTSNIDEGGRREPGFESPGLELETDMNDSREKDDGTT